MGLAELTRLRCVEAAEKGITWLNGFLGNPTDVLSEHDRHYAVDRDALAEYSWNPWGRPLEIALTAWCTKAGYTEPEVAAHAFLLLDRAILSLVNLASDQVARSVFDLALSQPLLDQITNVTLEKGLGDEPAFRRIEADCEETSRMARPRNWEGLAAVADMTRASSAIMRLAYPLWRWRENEGWLLSVQGTSVSQNHRRLARTQSNIRAILMELETANKLLHTASQYLGRKSRMQALAGLWQKLLPQYGLQTDTAVEWKERILTPDEKLK